MVSSDGQIFGKEDALKTIQHKECRKSRRVALKPNTLVAGRFSIGRLVGVGTFGAVYECVDTETPSKPSYAIKVSRNLKNLSTRGGPNISKKPKAQM